MVKHVTREGLIFVALMGLFVVTLAGAAYRHRWDPLLRPVTAALTVRQFVRRHDRGAWGATFVFQPIDCERSLAIIDSLNGITGSVPGTIRGLMIGTPREIPEWRDIAAVDGITFPVALIDPETAAAILDASGAEHTPTLIAVTAGGRIRVTSATAVSHALTRPELGPRRAQGRPH